MQMNWRDAVAKGKDEKPAGLFGRKGPPTARNANNEPAENAKQEVASPVSPKTEPRKPEAAGADGKPRLWQARGKKPVIDLGQKKEKEPARAPKKSGGFFSANWRSGENEEIDPKDVEEDIQPKFMKDVHPGEFLHQMPTGGEYQSRKGKTKTAIHWGQRKLLLSELQFMLRAKDMPGVTVLYAGAAPGIHMPWLAKKFEKLVKKWILVDPAEFDQKCYECAEVVTNFFTDATAWRIRRQTMATKGLALLTEVAQGVGCTIDVERARVRTGQVENIDASEMVTNIDTTVTPALDAIVDYETSKAPLLFISDIRTGNITEGGGKEFEDEVKRNMTDQARWTQILNPEVTMLKFRLPYMRYEHKGVVYEHPESTTRYLDGDVQLQLWAPQTSTETRLIVKKNAKEKEWNNKDYEDQMYHFNTVVRQQNHYNHDIPPAAGLDHRWDARAEVELLTEYVRWAQEIPVGKPVPPSAVHSLSKEMSTALGKTFDQQLSGQDKHFMQTATKQGWEEQAASIISKCKRERMKTIWWKNG